MVIKLDGLSEKEKKAQLEFAFLYPKSFELIKEEGRVEGMKQELKDSLTTLKAIDNILDSYESAQSLKLLIKVKEKRLKNLESGKE